MSRLSKVAEYYRVAGAVAEIEKGNSSSKYRHIPFYLVDMIKTRLQYRLGAAEYLKLNVYRLSAHQRKQIVTGTIETE